MEAGQQPAPALASDSASLVKRDQARTVPVNVRCHQERPADGDHPAGRGVQELLRDPHQRSIQRRRFPHPQSRPLVCQHHRGHRRSAQTTCRKPRCGGRGFGCVGPCNALNGSPPVPGPKAPQGAAESIAQALAQSEPQAERLQQPRQGQGEAGTASRPHREYPGGCPTNSRPILPGGSIPSASRT